MNLICQHTDSFLKKRLDNILHSDILEYIKQKTKNKIMSIAKNARASQVMADIKSGKHTPANKKGKFANYGSVAEDSVYYSTKLSQKADQARLDRIEASKARLGRRFFA